MPKALNSEARRQLREMSYAPTRVECERLRDEYVSDLRADGRSDAADTVLRDWESFVSFYDFPVEHWVHLRTTNPLESVFSAVRLRTDATRRMKRRDSALYLVFKVSLRLSERWRPLNGDRNLMGLLIDGARFEDGILTELPVSAEGQSPPDELGHLEAIPTTFDTSSEGSETLSSFEVASKSSPMRSWPFKVSMSAHSKKLPRSSRHGFQKTCRCPG